MRHYVSFGGGVQSTAVAMLVINNHPDLKAAMGEARPELWLFSDTGDEPQAVYDHVEVMKKLILDAGMEFATVSAGVLSEHVLGKASKGERGISLPPLFVSTMGNDTMPVRRGCTRDFKVKPLDAYAKGHFDVPRGYKGDVFVSQWYGISSDEGQRMKISQDRWRVFEYPLVRMGWSRRKCLDYLAALGIDAPRSACVYCPFHSAEEWQKVLAVPSEREKVFEFERQLHEAWDKHGSIAGLKTKPYLHRSRVPMSQVDHNKGQRFLWDAWDDECAGVCGV
jgi:hypothetical protein